MNGRLAGPRSQRDVSEKNCLVPVGIRTPDYPAHTLVAVPTTLSPGQMLDTNNKYEDQIHWILDEPSAKTKPHNQKGKKGHKPASFAVYHTNTEEIQIPLAGKTAEPTVAAPTLVLPITAFSHYMTRSINDECLTFKADCRIPFFFFPDVFRSTRPATSVPTVPRRCWPAQVVVEHIMPHQVVCLHTIRDIIPIICPDTFLISRSLRSVQLLSAGNRGKNFTNRK
jgi:hypothetical protein